MNQQIGANLTFSLGKDVSEARGFAMQNGVIGGEVSESGSFTYPVAPLTNAVMTFWVSTKKLTDESKSLRESITILREQLVEDSARITDNIAAITAEEAVLAKYEKDREDKKAAAQAAVDAANEAVQKAKDDVKAATSKDEVKAAEEDAHVALKGKRVEAGNLNRATVEGHAYLLAAAGNKAMAVAAGDDDCESGCYAGNSSMVEKTKAEIAKLKAQIDASYFSRNRS